MFETVKLNNTFVAEVRGISLNDELSDCEVEWLVNALAEHSVLLIRGRSMDVKQHQHFTKRLGQVRDQCIHSWTPEVLAEADPAKNGNLGRYPVINVGNVLYFVNGPGLSEGDEDPHAQWDQPPTTELGKGTSCWHTGDTEKVDVEVVNFLYAEVAPGHAGETLFCDTVAAYDALSPGMRSRLDELRVIHFFTHPKPTPPVSQPLVKQNPMTGRKSLYINYYSMDRIEGVSEQESKTLLDELFHHVTQDKFIYTHKWRQHDLVFWNCNTTMHKRSTLSSSERRVLRRTQAVIPALQSVKPWERTRLVEQ